MIFKQKNIFSSIQFYWLFFYLILYIKLGDNYIFVASIETSPQFYLCLNDNTFVHRSRLLPAADAIFYDPVIKKIYCARERARKRERERRVCGYNVYCTSVERKNISIKSSQEFYIQIQNSRIRVRTHMSVYCYLCVCL